MRDNKKTLLKVLQGYPVSPAPVWLMRQAGRYLPEYRKIREQAGDFLSLCFNPELAAEVTLQPVRRFGFDAAIIFSDILVIPYALGQAVSYEEGEGPKLPPLQNSAEIHSLKFDIEKLRPVARALEIVKEKLPKTCTLIGFAGAPWTVAAYMLEGKNSKAGGKEKRSLFPQARKFAQEHPREFTKLLEILISSTISYLEMQIDAGAEVVQIFDSWAGEVPEDTFDDWVIVPTQKIVAGVRKKYPHIPIIGFPRGVGERYRIYAEKTGVTAISIDQDVSLEWVIENIKIPVQGNLAPELLLGNAEGLEREINRICGALSGRPHIFNLGHGILKETPVENVERLVRLVKSDKKAENENGGDTLQSWRS